MVWTLAILGVCFPLWGTPAMAQDKIVVGYQPYDTISYQVSVNQELGLWKK